jgi:hypothetical protein
VLILNALGADRSEDTPPRGILYDYQKKEDVGEAIRMIVKTKGIRKAGLRGSTLKV